LSFQLLMRHWPKRSESETRRLSAWQGVDNCLSMADVAPTISRYSCGGAMVHCLLIWPKNLGRISPSSLLISAVGRRTGIRR
jgi:hypothetical protein